ncbi:MAG: hypothetical protein HYX62_01095 [Gammaproteobacteria bacterium]|jgi:hypothetical protein|nr:hypothetical protein [Gammaproteobacteria bacterium]
MGALELILELRRKGCSIVADGGYLDISPADNLSPEMVQQLKQSKTEILAELQRETRRQKVITLLEETPDIQRAFYADTDSDPHNVILAIAIRHVATLEMLIDKAKYDPWRLLALIHGQATH